MKVINKDVFTEVESYPRPNFKRNLWINLNGEWDFEFDNDNIGEKEKWYKEHKFSHKILVPFCYQSGLSGIGDKSIHDIIWYKKEFILPKSFNNKRVLLNFDSVDYYAKVWVNGQFVGSHKGGYVSFNFDITDQLIEGNNEVVVRVVDYSFDCSQTRGKQSWKLENFGCWYTRVSGIWKTVWLEAVDEVYIDRVKMTPDIDNGQLYIEAYLINFDKDLIFEVEILNNGKLIKKQDVGISEKIISFSVNLNSEIMQHKINYWTPDEPNLYDIIFTLKNNNKIFDKVKSYFGMRKISISNGKILLNNNTLYQKLILDQGYYDEGLLTPLSEQIYISDIKKIKSMGFNGIRIHQKIEDSRFLYWCDKLGLLVWAEMPSTYEFNDVAIENIMREWKDAIEKQYNHPSIIVWTLLNESWGVPELYSNSKQQSLANALYYMVKAYDHSRLVISNDGWEHTISDIITIHDYVEDGEEFRKLYSDKEKVINGEFTIANQKKIFAKGYKYKGQPIIISEYGGIAFSKADGWGYGNKVETEDEFIERFKKITHAIMDMDYVCGFCYTQLTDVEQEKNGLMYENHEMKILPEKIKEILDYKS